MFLRIPLPDLQSVLWEMNPPTQEISSILFPWVTNMFYKSLYLCLTLSLQITGKPLRFRKKEKEKKEKDIGLE